MINKICTNCQKLKPVSDFYNQKQGRNGKSSQCKICHNEKVKEWRIAHPGRCTINRKKWRGNKNNRKKDHLTRDRWKENNPEKYKQAYVNWRNKLRRRALVTISGNVQCVRCGCDKFECLEINHKNGGGAKELKFKKGNNQTFYMDIIKGRRSTDDLEILCKPCNGIHYLEMKHGKLPYLITWIKTNE